MNALIVGLGRMGSFHRKILLDLGYHVTTVDPDPAAGADHPTITDATLPRHAKYDTAAIACPAQHLVESAFQLAGTRMLIEKPFALDYQTAAMLTTYLNAAGAPVCVGFVERFNPQIRALKTKLVDLPRVTHARFTRWSDRPSWDARLDLLTHDIDLAHHLDLGYVLPFSAVQFDTRADQPHKVRRIELDHADGQQTTADLMDHNHSPLHALWHSFLTGQPVPGPDDATHALQVIEHMEQSEQVAA